MPKPKNHPELFGEEALNQTITDEQVKRIMHDFLLEYVLTPDGRQVTEKSVDGDEIYIKINEQEFVIFAPVGIKQAPALERRLIEHSKGGIATALVFPESSWNYDSHHIRHLGNELIKQGGMNITYHVSALSSVVIYSVDNYKSRMVQAFNPEEITLRTMQFRKLPEYGTAKRIGRVPYSEEAGDDALVEYVRALRADEEKGRPKGYLDRRLDQEDAKRFMELGWIKDDQYRARGRFSPEVIIKRAPCTLITKQVGRILLARIQAV